MSVLPLLRTELDRAGPARQAGHFHLLAQMKVTKAKGPTRFELSICIQGSAVDGHGSSQAEPFKEKRGLDRVEALFFGDFFLGQQKKVTRLPGGTGGLCRVGRGLDQ